MEFKKPTKHAKRQLRPNTPEPQPQPYFPPSSEPGKTLNINISLNPLPKIKLPPRAILFTRLRKLLFTKKALIIGGSLIIIAIVWSSFNQYEGSKNASTATDQNAIVENLEYQTVLPDGKTISELGGWRRVSPAESDPVYAYLDTLENVPISISQQPLPQSFKGSTEDQMAELAKKFNATTNLDAGSTKIHLGTSSKGPQSIILTKNGLLILIKSQQKISDKAWIKYVISLN